MYQIINKIKSPKDVKKMSVRELKLVAEESRQAILNRVSQVGGHLGSNMGMVETTIALHYVFDSPYDKLVFDVSHQSYTHKILTGRYFGFTNKKRFGEISGFTNPDESEHDIFNVGHTSTS